MQRSLQFASAPHHNAASSSVAVSRTPDLLYNWYYANFLNSTAIGLPQETLLGLKSSDGLTWVSFPVSYTPTSGHVVRGPYVLWSAANNKLFLAHSIVPNVGQFANTVFDIATSLDGVNFTYQQSVDCSAVVSGTGAAVWNTTWFVDTDSSVHIFFPASNSGLSETGFQLYEIHPTNAAMTTWSVPVIISGTSLPGNMIDPYMVKVGSTYNIWYKRDDTKFIEYMSSSSLTSGYTVTKSGDWAGWGSNMEGPVVVFMGGQNWRIYIDHDGAGIYHSESNNNWATWNTRSLITAPYTVVNGGIIPMPPIPLLP